MTFTGKPKGLRGKTYKRPTGRPPKLYQKALGWLEVEMAKGPTKAQDIFEATKGIYSPATMRRCKKDLGITSVQRNGEWYWQRQDYVESHEPTLSDLKNLILQTRTAAAAQVPIVMPPDDGWGPWTKEQVKTIPKEDIEKEIAVLMEEMKNYQKIHNTMCRGEQLGDKDVRNDETKAITQRALEILRLQEELERRESQVEKETPKTGATKPF